MAQDYNTTLNLPQTDFSMRGNLPQKEPGMIEDWDNSRMYYKMIEKNQGPAMFFTTDLRMPTATFTLEQHSTRCSRTLL